MLDLVENPEDRFSQNEAQITKIQNKMTTKPLPSHHDFVQPCIGFLRLFQRYEELSQKWDKAKHEVRQEDHEFLKEKVALQQELIKCQDEYAQQRRDQIAEQEQQVR